VTEGKDRALPALRELAAGASHARLFDMLFCEGCINGPKMPAPASAVARKEALIDWIHEHNRYTVRKELAESLAAFDRLDLSRKFDREAVVLPQPTEEEIAETLKQMRKFTPADQLNCGSCGYASCREKAIAVRQGFAEIDMCLPFMVEELEATVARLQRSDRELENTQDRLVQTERLASMGQISAGVAHEINNPLSTILLYTHLLLKRHREGDPEAEDIQMILSEATRCRSIMRGLLDFARQSRVAKAPTDLGAIVREVIANLAQKVQGTGTAVRGEVVASAGLGADGGVGGDPGAGHRLRLAAGGPAADLHALLHHEAAGQGHGHGPEHRLRRGEDARRRHLRGPFSRLWQHVPHPAAAGAGIRWPAGP